LKFSSKNKRIKFDYFTGIRNAVKKKDLFW